MREVQLRYAKANLSAVVDEAMRPVVITRKGKQRAVIVSYDEMGAAINCP
jgi:antitoxin Phd